MAVRRVLGTLLALIASHTSGAAQDAPLFGRWYVLGPLPQPPGPMNVEAPQPPEALLRTMGAGRDGPDLSAGFKWKGGALRWSEVARGADDGHALDVGPLDFTTLLAPVEAAKDWTTNQCAFLYRRIDCPSAIELPVMVGSDDALRLWLDGELLVDRNALRAVGVEDHQLVFELKPGTHHLFAKVVNASGAWGFQMARWSRVDQPAVDKAIDRGVQWLFDEQILDGSWGSHEEWGAGHTAFCAYTLLKCGVPADDPAVQLAFAAMDARACAHTYTAACEVLAWAATHDERWKPRIQRAVEQLLQWQGGQALCPYPALPGDAGVLPADLSNTLYAALAFRAARNAGVDVPEKAWSELAQGALRCMGKDGPPSRWSGNATGKAQTRSAGFSYRVGDNQPTGSMTTAGLSVLALAQEALQGKSMPQLVARARAATQSGLAWLDQNMQWSANPGTTGHHYFWIYGVERAGTLTGVDRIAGMDWYWSGATYLVKRQRDVGSWSSGGGAEDEPIDTLLALLFLRRATAPVTGSVPASTTVRRSTQPSTGDVRKDVARWDADGAQEALAVHARGTESTVLWTSGLREDLRQSLCGPKGLEVQSLEFLGRCADDARDAETLLGTVAGRVLHPDDLPQLELAHVFERPGTWTIRARLHVIVAGTQPRVVDSPALSFAVRDVFDRRRLEYARDPERNLLHDVECRVEASSNTAAAKSALDGRYASAWKCDAKDATPWLRLAPQHPIQAERLVLAHADPRARRAGDARPLEIEVVLNGDVRLSLVMDTDVRRKSALELPPRTPVRTLELRIRSVRDGRLGASSPGFSEIELFGAR